MIADTPNECGDNRDGSPASFSRCLTSLQISFVVSAFPVSCFVRRTVERNSGRSLFSAPMPTAAR